jgi:aspartate kinase
MISQSSSEHNICFVVGAEHTSRLIRDLERAFAAELGRHDVGRVYAEQPMAIVAAVGEGMKGTPGVAARVFTALGRAKINVVAIAQGSSELNISLVVDEAQRDAAVRAIHEEFHGRATRVAAAS